MAIDGDIVILNFGNSDQIMNIHHFTQDSTH
jgi:hypothetical protein